MHYAHAYIDTYTHTNTPFPLHTHTHISGGSGGTLTCQVVVKEVLLRLWRASDKTHTGFSFQRHGLQ